MKKQAQVTVIGNATADKELSAFAYKIGLLLGKLQVITITGGKGGVMEAVAKGVSETGGISVGLLPGENKDESNKYNSIIIPTGIGFARNSMNVLAGDIIIAIGGGAGTLSEIAYAWVYNKPVFCYDKEEGWAQQLAGKALDDKFSNPLNSFSTIKELEEKLQAYL